MLAGVDYTSSWPLRRDTIWLRKKNKKQNKMFDRLTALAAAAAVFAASGAHGLWLGGGLTILSNNRLDGMFDPWPERKGKEPC